MSKAALHTLAALLALSVLSPHTALADLSRRPAAPAAITTTTSTASSVPSDLEAPKGIDQGLRLRRPTSLGDTTRRRKMHMGEHGALLQISEAFSYARNNPVNFADPTGLASVGEFIEQGGMKAAQDGRSIAAAGWAFAKAANDVFGFEGVSRVVDASITDRSDVGTGDYAMAAVEVATMGKGGGAISVASAGAQAMLKRAAGATTRVFWSGTGPDAAAKVARSVGGKTLEMTWPGRALDKITTRSNFKFVKPLWESASRTFAQGAKGPVTAVQGAKVRVESVWRQIEYPELLKQGNEINYRLLK